jgi:hypothetical protein
MSDYLNRLKAHPGVPIASLVSVAGPVVALLRHDGVWQIGLFMLVFWIPVFITARTQPLPEDSGDTEWGVSDE